MATGFWVQFLSTFSGEIPMQVDTNRDTYLSTHGIRPQYLDSFYSQKPTHPTSYCCHCDIGFWKLARIQQSELLSSACVESSQGLARIK